MPRPGVPSGAAAAAPAPAATVAASLPSRLGALTLVGVDEGASVTTAIALVGEPRGKAGVPVYVHHACLFGDALRGSGCARAEALRTAFVQTMADAEFLADAEKAQLEVNPVSGAAIDKLVGELYETPPDVIAEVRAVISEGAR